MSKNSLVDKGDNGFFNENRAKLSNSEDSAFIPNGLAAIDNTTKLVLNKTTVAHLENIRTNKGNGLLGLPNVKQVTIVELSDGQRHCTADCTEDKQCHFGDTQTLNLYCLLESVEPFGNPGFCVV